MCLNGLFIHLLCFSLTYIYDPAIDTFEPAAPAPEMLLNQPAAPVCTLFFSEKHNSRPVVLLAAVDQAYLFDYTIANDWEESKYHLYSFDKNHINSTSWLVISTNLYVPFYGLFQTFSVINI